MGKEFFRKKLTQTGSPFKLKPGQYILRLLTAWFFGAFATVLVGNDNAFLSPLLGKKSLLALFIIGIAVFIGTCFLQRDKLVYTRNGITLFKYHAQNCEHNDFRTAFRRTLPCFVRGRCVFGLERP